MKKKLLQIFLLYLCIVTLPAVADDFDLDSLFEDAEALEIDEGELVENPESTLFVENSFTWFGDFSGKVGTTIAWEHTPSALEELRSFEDALTADLKLRLWFDARPDRNFRVFGKFITGWPFSQTFLFGSPPQPSASPVVGTPSVSIPNLSVFELFADFNWQDSLFFRFGKQTASWGLSRFYQIGDPLSVAVKDPENPTEDLEGPVALRLSLPLGVHTLYAWSALKDSYLSTDGSPASVSDLGFGIKGDFLVSVPSNPIVSNGEFSLGSWYQKELAPKFVAGYSTGIGDFQLFTDQLFTWGLDSVQEGDTEKRESGLFWSATLGSMYVQNDWHFTAYGEYLYTGHLDGHDSSLSLSWAEVCGTEKISFSTFWLQNWVDLSGLASGKITFAPFKYFAIETGLSLSWGESTGEWIIKTGNPATGSPVRTSASLIFILGSGKF